MNPAGLYIHIPFCQSKCGYCSFNSIPASRKIADEYLQTIHQQIATYSTCEQIKSLTFDSIFFGGGTPTLASPEKLCELLDILLGHFTFTPDLEISIEANPNSISKQDLITLNKARFNRLSLGVQSFQDQILARINRSHSGKEAKQAVLWGYDAGFANINCDLIYGLPGQTLANWQTDLHTIADLQPNHLSLYELVVEPGTAFHAEAQAKSLILPDDDILADMEAVSKTTLDPIYDQYEISNFARDGKQCRHNLTYWHNGSYLGLGAGAVSSINGVRFTHQPSPHLFMDTVKQNKSTIVQTECLSPKASFRETMIMSLRLVQGVNLCELEQQTQLQHHEIYGSLLGNLIETGQLKYKKPYLSIPRQSLGLANQILCQLV